MSDAPKKPVKRKATPKVAAAKLETKAKGMNDQEMREAVLARALPHAAFDGFTDQVLQKAGDEAGVTKTDLARLFEDGPIG